MKLKPLQQAFLAHIDNKDNTIESMVSSNDYALATQRLMLYRLSAKGNFIEALKNTYPVINKLIGTDCFEEVCDKFIQNQPYHSFDVTQYGQAFATFLPLCPPLKNLPYLPDVARLEWAIHVARDTTDNSRVALSDLQNTPEPEQHALRFSLPNHASLLFSEYPIFTIWRVNQLEYQGDNVVNLDEGKNRLLVHLWQDEVCIEKLKPIEFEMLVDFQKGATLESVLQQCIKKFPEQDIPNSFAILVSRGWLTKS